MDKSPFDDPSLNENAAWMPLVHQVHYILRCNLACLDRKSAWVFVIEMCHCREILVPMLFLALSPTITQVLGSDAQLRYKGLVVAEPGTGNQDYHPDTPYVPRAEWMRHRTLDTHNTLLPPHCLVVFIPTVDLTDANGPTAFLPGSQHHTLYMENLLAEATEPGCTSGARLPAVLDVDAGDAVVMDARLQHAGTANRSDTRRTLLYLVYTCKWFTVDLHKRLLEESGLVAPGGGGQAEGLFPLRGTGD